MNSYFTIMMVMLQINQLNGERTINSILHILNGKRSSQTIIDIQLFQLSSFFGLYEKMSRKDFDEIIDWLVINRWITEDKHSHLTPLGRKKLDEFLTKENLTLTLDGWNFHHLEKSFYQKLILMVQVLSNIKSENKSFVPIVKQKKVQIEVKQILSNKNKKEFANQFYEQLLNCLNVISDKVDPTFIVIHLSGYERSGKTVKQVIQLLNLEKDNYLYLFKSCLHALMSEIVQNKQKYSLLFLLIENEVISPITLSTLETEVLLEQGHSIETISTIRNLKTSTIEDHLVELAMFRVDFPIDIFVTPLVHEKIVFILRELNSKKLKLIKDRIEEATYFQIRLVIAREGMSWN